MNDIYSIWSLSTMSSYCDIIYTSWYTLSTVSEQRHTSVPRKHHAGHGDDATKTGNIPRAAFLRDYNICSFSDKR